MEESQNIDFKGISLHMKKEMSRIRMLRIVFRILTSIVYLCTVVWFGFCIFGGFLVDRTDYETSVTTGKYLMIGFAVFFVPELIKDILNERNQTTVDSKRRNLP